MASSSKKNKLPTHELLVETWLKGWSLSRGVMQPIQKGTALHVQVGWPDQQARYVFPHFTEEVSQLAIQITQPWVFLKVCAPPAPVSRLLPPRWTIQEPGYMMTCLSPMAIGQTSLAAGYQVQVMEDQPVYQVRILNEGGETGASGYIALVDGMAIYDRIITHPAHRRRGLATVVMKTLESIAWEQQITQSILVATEEGKALYGSLGWQLHCHYTSAVIPGKGAS